MHVPWCVDTHVMRVSVHAKLLAAFGLLVALMIAVGWFGIARLANDNQHLDQLATQVVPSTRAVGDINALMNKYRKDQLHYIVALPADRPLNAPGSIAGDLDEDLSLMSDSLHTYRLRNLGPDAADRALLDTFDADFARYVTITASFARLADRGHILAAGEVVGNGSGDAAWDKLKTVIAAWSDHQVKTARDAEAGSNSSYQRSRSLILALLAAAVAIALGVAFAFARRTTRAVREIGSAAKAISQGDINQRVAVRSRDEFGEMAKDFDSMIDYLRSTVALAETIAEGNLEVDVRPRSERDALGNSLVVMTDSLRRLAAENDQLLSASQKEANTDALTALPNRRALMHDLENNFAAASEEAPVILALFDLNGFKQYNDTFGHPAGDALLTRVGDRLERALRGAAVAYRMGGDEFCVLASTDTAGGAAIARRAANALSEKGEAFNIDCCYGVATLPQEASSAADALRLADQRMYEGKAGRVSASRQTTDVLLTALSERSPGLCDHIDEVTQLSGDLATVLGLPEAEVTRIRLAAELHDIGKVAIPETILNKPGPLDAEEWEFMRRHTEVGARIVGAAPSLAHTAELVRLHHEHHDGGGYPDRLAGDDIPLGASIIGVCDAFGAMTKTRPYSDAISVADALAELRRCSGSQFRPDVVTAFDEMVKRPAVDAVDVASPAGPTSW
jgi:diguanylate cyclase (GGDEF)-like protein/putative nucleotidyltransferase with HDIG domain